MSNGQSADRAEAGLLKPADTDELVVLQAAVETCVQQRETEMRK